MNKEDLQEIIKYVSLLENDCTIRIRPKDLPGYIEGFTIPKNNHYCIVINQNLSNEEQLKALYHEAKHIYDIEKALNTDEKECDYFSQSYYQVACEIHS